MSPPSKSWPKLLSIWMNAAVDAWNMGEADWLFSHEGRSVLVHLWSHTFDRTDSEMMATEAVVAYARSQGVDPKIHKVHAR